MSRGGCSLKSLEHWDGAKLGQKYIHKAPALGRSTTTAAMRPQEDPGRAYISCRVAQKGPHISHQVLRYGLVGFRVAFRREDTESMKRRRFTKKPLTSQKTALSSPPYLRVLLRSPASSLAGSCCGLMGHCFGVSSLPRHRRACDRCGRRFFCLMDSVKLDGGWGRESETTGWWWR